MAPGSITEQRNKIPMKRVNHKLLIISPLPLHSFLPKSWNIIPMKKGKGLSVCEPFTDFIHLIHQTRNTSWLSRIILRGELVTPDLAAESHREGQRLWFTCPEMQPRAVRWGTVEPHWLKERALILRWGAAAEPGPSCGEIPWLQVFLNPFGFYGVAYFKQAELFEQGTVHAIWRFVFIYREVFYSSFQTKCTCQKTGLYLKRVLPETQSGSSGSLGSHKFYSKGKFGGWWKLVSPSHGDTHCSQVYIHWDMIVKGPQFVQSQGGRPGESIVETNDSCKCQIPCFLHSACPILPSIYSSTGDRPLAGLGQKLLLRNLNA